MSKLPDRDPSSGYIRPEDGVGYVIANENGEKRTIITAHGIHLNPADFSDLKLPALLFLDESGDTHEISINHNRILLIDDHPVFDLNVYYTKTDIDQMLNLTAPNGTRFRLTVSNDGTVHAVKM